MTFRQRDDPAERLRVLLDAGRSRAPGDPEPPDADWWDDADDADDIDEPGDGEVGALGSDQRYDARSGARAPAGARHARPPAITAPLGLRERFTAVSHPVVVTVLLAAVAAGLLFGMRLVRARADALPIPALSTMTDPRATGGGEPSAAGGASGDSRVSGSTAPGPPATDISSGGSASAGAMVRVHVVGQVKRPGVVEVSAGARILDAIEAAGGATSKADLDAINLARAVVDGEQIQVLRPGESPTPASGSAAPATGSGSGGTGGGPGVKVPINTADLAQLDTLPGVGPVLAQRILDWRSQHGAFASIDQLGEVSGIGEKLLANLTPLVTL